MTAWYCKPWLKKRSIMNVPTTETTNRSRRLPRWLLILAVILVVVLVIVLLATLLRSFGSEPQVWLRIAPAASTVDEATAIILSSGGWRSDERVAICLNKPDDMACDAEVALQIENADSDGNLDSSVLAAALLAEGRTTFLVRGLESGQLAERSFRVLRAADASLAAAGTATPLAPDATIGLTPISGGQPSDVSLPANGSIEAGEVATFDPSIVQFPDWRGEYFTNPDLAGEPALVRNDPDPNLDWGEASPAPGVIPPDGFSVRWSRSLNFDPGVYRFVLTAQDGGRLLVEGQPVIDAWQGAEGQTVVVDQALSGGQYQIVVHFRDLAGPASIAIGWSPLTTATPVQVAGVEATPTPDVLPTPTPDAVPTPPPTTAPGDAPTATPTGDLPAATATPDTGTPGATETTLPTSSVTASATETSVTPNDTATPETTPGTPTMTPTAVTSGTPLTPPGSVERLIEINPSVGLPGESIEINSGNWSPGTVLRVSLGEFNTSYTQAVVLPGVTYTTPLDSSQAWAFRFTYPNEPPWSTQRLPVLVWVHSVDWSQWGSDKFDIDIDNP